MNKIESHIFEWESKKVNVVVSYGIANTEELGKEENETNFVQKADSLGLYLVKTLTEHQLDGKIELNRKEGTKYHILFKRADYRKRI